MCAVFAIVPSSERLESVSLAQAFTSVYLRTQAKRMEERYFHQQALTRVYGPKLIILLSPRALDSLCASTM